MKVFVLSTPYNEFCVIPFFYSLGMDIVVLREHHEASEFDFHVGIFDSINDAMDNSDCTVFIKSPQLDDKVIENIDKLSSKHRCYIIDEKTFRDVEHVVEKNIEPSILLLSIGDSTEIISLELQLISCFAKKGIAIKGALSPTSNEIIRLINTMNSNGLIFFNDQAKVRIHTILNFENLEYEIFKNILDTLSPDYVILCVESAEDLKLCVASFGYKWEYGLDLIVTSNHFTYERYGTKYNIMGKPNDIRHPIKIFFKNSEIPVVKNITKNIDNICHNILLKISLPDDISII